MSNLLKFLQHNGVDVKSETEMLKLKVIDLSAIDLTSLPPGICNLINLENLNLSCNKLTTLPKEIGNLINLKELNLFYNNLETIPSELYNLSKLERLNLSENKFQFIPLGIDRLPKDLFPPRLYDVYDEAVKFRKAVKIIERAWIAYDWAPNSDGIARCALRSFRELQESNPEIFS